MLTDFIINMVLLNIAVVVPLNITFICVLYNMYI